jgi:hypothetical protein
MTEETLRVVARICGLCGELQFLPAEQADSIAHPCASCRTTNKFRVVGELPPFQVLEPAAPAEQGDKYRG